MGEITEVAERRMHKRFQAQKRALVYFGSGADGMAYHLIEVSNGGFSFRYLGEDELIEGLSELSMVFEDYYYISEMSVQIVSDTLIAYSYIPIRRIGMRFGELSSMQKTQVNDFMKKNIE